MKKLTLGAKAMKAGLEKGLSGDDLDIYADIFVYSFRSAALVEFLFGELSLDAVTARAEMSEEEFASLRGNMGPTACSSRHCWEGSASSRASSAEIFGLSSMGDFLRQDSSANESMPSCI